MTRRDTLRTLGLAALVAPFVTACGGGSSSSSTVTGGNGGIKLVSADVARSAGDPAAIADVVGSMGGLTTGLWGALADTDSGSNLALSPYSIAVALMMTANGAKGDTLSQMQQVLGLSALDTANAGLDALTLGLEKLAGPVTLPDGTKDAIALAPANQLFGDRSVTWAQDFLTVLARDYGAGMRAVDFRHDDDGARDLVNQWTSDQTRGRIPQILPDGAVDALTRLVLVNALYLKAPWASPFQKQATQPGTFHTAGGGTVTAQLMSGRVGSYVTGSHYEGARLPYSGNTLALTAVLPTEGHEADALTELLSGGLTGAASPGLTLTMPKFTFRSATGLTSVLEGLGMTDAFADSADFTGMTTTVPIHVSDVYHQAFIAVDEHGTEAAAATAVAMGTTAMPAQQHSVVLDRPFLFVIHDVAHGTPLFVGRVADPTG